MAAEVSIFIGDIFTLAADWTAAAIVGTSVDKLLFAPYDESKNVYWQAIEALVEMSAGMVAMRIFSAILDPSSQYNTSAVFFDSLSSMFLFAYMKNTRAKLMRLVSHVETALSNMMDTTTSGSGASDGSTPSSPPPAPSQ